MTLLEKVDAMIALIPDDDWVSITLRAIRENIEYSAHPEFYERQVRDALRDRLPDHLGQYGNPPIPDWKDAVMKIWES